jgi:hypothetical protein
VIPFSCQRCGADVATVEGRYEAVLEIRHLAEPLEMSEEDLLKDHAAEIRRLLREMAGRDPREMEEHVIVRRERRLCTRCRADVLAALEGDRAARA